MLVPNRHANSSKYRYGFQGQEMDNEIKGEGNSINYTYRMHDPRVGRFFAIDPLESKYPMLSPYQFSGNRPIDSKEIEGLEGFQYTKYDIVNGQKIPIKQIVEVDVVVLVTTNQKDKVSFRMGTGEKIEKILNENFNPTEVYKDNWLNRTLRKNKIGEKKREYKTTIEGHTVPVEFIFNVREQIYEGGETIRERYFKSNNITFKNKSEFTSSKGELVRGTVTISRISATSESSIASSGSDGIIFKRSNETPIVHEIIHNFYSYNKNLFMGGSAERHADESIGGGGAMIYGSSNARPSQVNIDFILKTVPLISEDKIPNK